MQSERHYAGRRDLLWGTVWAGGGLLVTGLSYTGAEPGGQYMFFWGAVLYGAFRLLRGLFRLAG